MTIPPSDAVQPSGAGSTYTGYRRNKKTPWSIRAKDALAQVLITTGGIGTIVAVALMSLFLIWVVIPLFINPDVDERSLVPPAWEASQVPLHTAIDEYNLMSWSVFPDGTVRTIRLDNGAVLDEASIAPDPAVRLSSWSFPQRGSMIAAGYSDGTVRLGNIEFDLSFMQLDEAPPALRALAVGAVAVHGKGLAQMTPERQIRLLSLKVTMEEPVATGSTSPIIGLDHVPRANAPAFVSLSQDGAMRLHRITVRRNMMTGARSYSTQAADIPYQLDSRRGLPDYVLLSGLGDNVFVVWRDGHLERFDCRDLAAVSLVETLDITPEAGVEITTVGFMIGKTTLLVGDSSGRVRSFFRTRPVRPDDIERRRAPEPDLRRNSFFAEPGQQLDTGDRLTLSHIGTIVGDGAGPVTSMASSQRKRILAVGHADGTVRLHNLTNERLLLETRVEAGAAVRTIMLNPRDNGLVAMTEGLIKLWDLDLPHPETSVRALFGKVWYEGYAEPTHTWQSTGGTDDFESKFGVLPLIFGTIKATVFAMIFAVPIALMAAIYTSEFLQPKLKAKVKPAIEMMASLPSVVLGFLAGLVVAQFVEDVVPAVLCLFLTVPLAFLLLSYCSQMLPVAERRRLMRWRFLAVFLSLPLGIGLAFLAGPVVERLLFWVEYPRELVAGPGGDMVPRIEYNIRAWLSAHRQDFPEVGTVPAYHSSPIGGWMLLFTPLAALATVALMTLRVNPWLSRCAQSWTWHRLALADALKFVIGAVVTIVVALALSVLVGIFWDARGGYVDQYVQRNALIVGVIMGFAVIPIIYTIADDALSAVPESLRSASLGAGATPWQTAVRVIVPTAMSGLFSACMIGFGRAVGETMIVLMAAGNTPIMEWNIFNGFRTLSANIAVEMMEAVKDSTNYRVLFLCALTLFFMTFVINTVAESVRLRYRKRAFEL